MNPLMAAIIARLLEYVARLGDEYLERGLRLLMDALIGNISDDQLLAFLRDRARTEAKS